MPHNTPKHPRIPFFWAFPSVTLLENAARHYIKAKCFAFLYAREAQINIMHTAAAVSQGSKIRISEPILMKFGPRSTILRSGNSNMRLDCNFVDKKLLFETNEISLFTTFPSSNLYRIKSQFGQSNLKFELVDIKIVDTCPKIIQIGQGIPILGPTMRPANVNYFVGLL